MQRQSNIVVFGLGNPGRRYDGTRHNVGFDTAAAIAALAGVRLRKRCLRLYREASADGLRIIQPLTYMNNSGEIAGDAVKDGDTLIVVVDNMDLPPGRIRIRKGGSSAGHNGLKSMIANAGSDFIRIYIGVGRPEKGIDVAEHVLSGFSEEERALVNEAVGRAAAAVIRLWKGEELERVEQDANSI